MERQVFADLKWILLFGDGAADDRSLDGFVPDDPEHFGVSAKIFIGDRDDDRADSFDVMLCTPSWLSARLTAAEAWTWPIRLSAPPTGVLPGAGFWFMARWDREAFLYAVRAVCTSASPGPDWGTVADRIGRLIPWEYDYRYDEQVNARFGERFPRS